LLNIQSLNSKVLIVNYMISDYNLTETWLKTNDYITSNESTPQDYHYKHEPRPKGKGLR